MSVVLCRARAYIYMYYDPMCTYFQASFEAPKGALVLALQQQAAGTSEQANSGLIALVVSTVVPQDSRTASSVQCGAVYR